MGKGLTATLLAAKAAKVNSQNPIHTVSSIVKLSKKVIIQPFVTLHVMGLCKVPFMAKGLDAMIEAGKEPFSDSVTTVNSYSHIKQGSTQVPLGLCNHTCRVVTILAKTVVARVTAADEGLPGLAPKLNKGEDAEMEQKPTEPGKLNQLLENLDLSGITK